MTNLQIAKNLLALVDHRGWADAGHFHLSSQEQILDEQEVWDDEDPEKDLDLTTSPYWMVSTDGIIEGIDSAEELAEYL